MMHKRAALARWLSHLGTETNCRHGRSTRRGSIERLEDRYLLAATPLITELMADNQSTLYNEFLDGYPDWVEICNPGPDSVDLEGWYLTDRKSELHGWQFPSSRVLDEGEYVLVFASGTDPGTELPEGEWHTDFKLRRSGEYLALVHPDGTTIAAEYEPAYPPQSPDVSYGLTAGFDEETFFSTPTPGAPNPATFKASVFSQNHGFYMSPIQVALDTETLDGPVHYTLDGSPPTLVDPLYEGPIQIQTTTALRARAFGPGSDGTVYTRTYLFLPDTVAQPAAPSGWPAVWQDANGAVTPADYEFDSEVATDLDYVGSLSEDLLALPTVALTMDPADLLDPDSGIYANPLQSGGAWERATSLEWIDPDGHEGFQIDAGIRVRGGGSRDPGNTPKHSFRLAFKTQYGPSILKADLFGGDAVSQFDRLDLTAGFQDTWLDPAAPLRQRAVLMRDQWVRDTHRDMGHASPSGRFVHLYLNGLYWGVYNLAEHIDNAFGAIHFGGRKGDYDVIDSGALADGEIDTWQAMLDLANGGLQTDEAYQQIEQYLDTISFIDFMVLRVFAGDLTMAEGDWFALRNRARNEPFRFFTTDSEETLQAVDDNLLESSHGNGDDVTSLFGALSENAGFRRLVGDRVHRHFFADGALTAARNSTRWQARSAALAEAVVAESARWGDYRRDVHPFESGPFALYTRNNNWQVESVRLLDDYFPGRSDVVLGQFRQAALYPTVDAPVFSSPGGILPPGFALTLDVAQGNVFYTTDGTDPALHDGSLAPAAIRFAGPISLDHDTVVRSRARVGELWSALAEASFFKPMPLQITEIMYHSPVAADGNDPYSDEDYDFVELINAGPETLDLNGVAFSGGIGFSFADATTTQLAQGQRLIVVGNIDAFSSRYGSPSVAIAGQYNGRLNNSGERVLLSGSLGQRITEVTYDDGWYSITDGEGFSLARRDETAAIDVLSDANHWRPSQFQDGSPGAPDAGLNPDSVVISEALTHSDGELGDWLELHNTTRSDIDIGGWYLSDTKTDLQLYQIPEGIVLPAHGYLVFSANVDPNFGPGFGGQFNFTIDKLGETVYLTSVGRDNALGGYRDSVTFTYGFNSTTFIRHTNSTGQTEYIPALQKTPGRPNSLPAVDRIRDHGTEYLEAVISEIMYFPAGDGDEYIELYNPHREAVHLDAPFSRNWRFTNGVSYNFPDAAVIPPRSFVLIVPIDPDSFRVKYNVPAETQIFGPYSGELLNTGERLTLARAAEPAAFVPFSMMDQVVYNNTPGVWPVEANGLGASLNRVSYRAYGNDVLNWTAGMMGGTPGRPNVDLDPSSRVMERMVFYNGSSFDGFDAAGNAMDDSAIAVDKSALLPGMRAGFPNYTSFLHGITGIMVDIQNLPGTLDAGDFEFRIGNNHEPGTWAVAPSAASVITRRGAGVDGSDRVTVTWANDAIMNQWLQVRVLATPNTGLVTDDVHYWGNAVADTGNSPAEMVVDARDLHAVLANAAASVAVINAYDINRDGAVDPVDVQLVETVIDASPRPLVRLDLGGGSVVPGDVNDDGHVNGLDVMPFVDLLLNNRYLSAADMNRDGHVNGLDVDAFVPAILGEGTASVSADAAIVTRRLLVREHPVHPGRDRPGDGSRVSARHRVIERIFAGG
jgi:hypothetical protein